MAAAESSFVSDLRVGLRELCAEPLHSDVVIVAEGGRRIRAHRVVLSLRSAHLRALLAQAGSRGDDGEPATVVLEGVRHAVAQMLVRYLYTDELECGPCAPAELLQLAALAEQCGCAHAAARAESELLARLNAANAAELLASAAECGAVPRLFASAVRLLATGVPRAPPPGGAAACARAARAERLAPLGARLAAAVYRQRQPSAPLVEAALDGRADALAELLSCGEAPDAASAGGRGLRALGAALSCGRVELAHRLVERGASVDAPSVPHGNSCLHNAALHAAGRFPPSGAWQCSPHDATEPLPPQWAQPAVGVRAARWLLARGACANALNLVGQTPLDALVHAATADALAAPPPVARPPADGAAAAAAAAAAARREACELLLGAGGVNRLCDEAGETLWHAAARHGQGALLQRLLLADSTQLDARDERGSSALFVALRHRQHNAARVLLHAGAWATSSDCDGFSAMEYVLFGPEARATATAAGARADGADGADDDNVAAAGGGGGEDGGAGAVEARLRMAALLLELGLPLPRLPPDASGAPLAAGACEGVGALLHGAVLLDGAGGQSALPDSLAAFLVHYAAQSAPTYDVSAPADQPAGARALGGALEPRAAGARTPLHVASARGNVKALHHLLLARADPNARDALGATALHLAAAPLRSCGGATLLLISHGAHVHATDARGRTPLHAAAAARAPLRPMRILLEANADINARCTADGWTPLHVLAHCAREAAWTEALRALLVEHGARLDLADRAGQTAAHLAAARGRVRLLQQLVLHGAPLHLPDEAGRTPLDCLALPAPVPPAPAPAPPSARRPAAPRDDARARPRADGDEGEGEGEGEGEDEMSGSHAAPTNARSANGSAGSTAHGPAPAASEARARELAAAAAAAAAADGSARAASAAVARVQRAVLACIRQPPLWLPDVAVRCCQLCSKAFGPATRRHHCRHCGRILCDSCSAHRAPIGKFGAHAPLRVCDACADVLAAERRAAQPHAPPPLRSTATGAAAGEALAAALAAVDGAPPPPPRAAGDDGVRPGRDPSPPRRLGAGAPRVIDVDELEGLFD